MPYIRSTPCVALRPDTSAYGLINLLPHWKADPDRPWISDCPAQVLQQSVKDVSSAYANFFKGQSSYPKFHKKSNRQTAVYPNQAASIRDGKLYLLKNMTPIKVKWTKQSITGLTINNISVSKTPAGHYYVSFSCKYQPAVTSGTAVIGIDMGLHTYATISDGTTIEPLQAHKKLERRLAKYQRRMSRKQKGSNNRAKAGRHVSVVSERIANQRNDYLHKLSRNLVNTSQLICIEDLNVKGMLRNHKLAKSIQDASWSMFRHMLMYKAAHSQHCTIVEANRWFPSTQMCSVCYNRPSEPIKLGVYRWTCEYCKSEHGRDHNAAKNLQQLAYQHGFENGVPLRGRYIKTEAYVQ